MEPTTRKNYNFESFDIFTFVYTRKKILFLLTIIGAIVSIIVSFRITPKFKSSVIFFPASSASISQELLSENPTPKSVRKFGEEEELEQLLQVLQSDDIRSKIIKKFNLIEHYKIDTTAQYPMTLLTDEFNANIGFARTEYQSIRIDAMDKEPQMAADIANEIASQLDTTMNRMQKERARKALSIVEREYFSLKSQMKKLDDSLTMIRNFGINDYETQSQVFNTELAKALASGNAHAVKSLEEKISILSKYGSAYQSMTNFLKWENERLSLLKAKYAQAKVDAEQTLPYKFIVNRAFKAERKSYPVRWLIVSVSTISTFVITLLLLITLDILKQVRRNEN